MQRRVLMTNALPCMEKLCLHYCQLIIIIVVAVMRRGRRLGWFINFIVQVATVLHARNEDEDE